MKMKRTRLLVLSTICLPLIVQCSSDGREPRRSATPDLRPVRDVAPYICDLVPEPEFRRATGVQFPVTWRWGGDPSTTGLCLAHGARQEAPLGIHWDYRNGAATVLRMQDDLRDNS